MTWQPIETAPKDKIFLGAIHWDAGTEFEQWEIAIMEWERDYKLFIKEGHPPFSDDQEQPSHWMPLPDPPK